MGNRKIISVTFEVEDSPACPRPKINEVAPSNKHGRQNDCQIASERTTTKLN